MTDPVGKPITRRTIARLAAPAVLAAALPRAAWAEGKRVAYLTPGLDLPFWRTLGKGIEDETRAAAEAPPPMTATTRRRRNCRTRRTPSPSGRRHHHLAHRQLDGAPVSPRRSAPTSRW